MMEMTDQLLKPQIGNDIGSDITNGPQPVVVQADDGEFGDAEVGWRRS